MLPSIHHLSQVHSVSVSFFLPELACLSKISKVSHIRHQRKGRFPPFLSSEAYWPCHGILLLSKHGGESAGCRTRREAGHSHSPSSDNSTPLPCPNMGTTCVPNSVRQLLLALYICPTEENK